MPRFYLPAIVFLLITAMPVSAQYIPLKGANGNIVKFKVEEVGKDDIQVYMEGGYRKISIKWEQLDLEWLKENQAELWQQKMAVEAAARIAYQDFSFGQSRNAVIARLNAQNAVLIPNEFMKEGDSNAMWVALDPEKLRRFYRFRFDEEHGLVELKLLHNFNREESPRADLQTEWKRLAELVGTYHSKSVKAEPFPSSSDWRRITRGIETGKEDSEVTHRWEDNLREFELAIESKKLGFGEQKTGESRTLFGKKIFDGKSEEINTNWVTLTAKLRSAK